jgi:metal-responsive CopG/Arc/MetJ family transcriptional regulator
MANIPHGKKQITITLPDYIVEKLEELASKDPLLSKRSQQASKIIIEYFKDK